MPKKVLDAFFTAMVREIRNSFKPGDKYYSIRDLSVHHKVSIQTAQRGVKRLQEYGYISVKQKAGITIESVWPQKKLKGYRLSIVSARTDDRFNAAFLGGINEIAGKHDVAVRFEKTPPMDFRSLQFGDHLLSLNADGIICLYFRNSALPFYHVMREGMDIVTDIIPDVLPILPAVQTDNFHHASEAGRIFLEHRYNKILVIGYYPQDKNRRYDGLLSVIKDSCKEIKYAYLPDIDSVSIIDTFFHRFDSNCAVFSNDYSANYIAGAKFMQYKIPVRNDNFLVYDCEEDVFIYHGLNPAKRVGPSLHYLGQELCKVILTKQETGNYPEPRQRRI